MSVYRENFYKSKFQKEKSISFFRKKISILKANNMLLKIKKIGILLLTIIGVLIPLVVIHYTMHAKSESMPFFLWYFFGFLLNFAMMVIPFILAVETFEKSKTYIKVFIGIYWYVTLPICILYFPIKGILIGAKKLKIWFLSEEL